MHIDIKRVVDIELTNRCNATCSFCPREKTPKQGFMSMEVFRQAVDRVLEFGADIPVYLTGLGEPMLHPEFLTCVHYLEEKGIAPRITTNASRLFRDNSQELLDAGLRWIDFSVSDLGENYRKVYNLDFAVTLKNIRDFLDVNAGRAHTQVTIVRHDDNASELEEMEAFWKNEGIDEVRSIREINRGGSCAKEYYFQGGERYKEDALNAIRKAGFTELCALPFTSIFIGWNGKYYLCCMDWEKTVPLGDVFSGSIHEVDRLKYDFLVGPSPICAACSVNPVNDLCEIMHEVEHGKRGKFAVANRLKVYKTMGYDCFTHAMRQHAESDDIIASN